MTWRDGAVLGFVFAVVVAVFASAIQPHNKEKP